MKKNGKKYRKIHGGEALKIKTRTSYDKEKKDTWTECNHITVGGKSIEGHLPSRIWFPYRNEYIRPDGIGGIWNNYVSIIKDVDGEYVCPLCQKHLSRTDFMVQQDYINRINRIGQELVKETREKELLSRYIRKIQQSEDKKDLVTESLEERKSKIKEIDDLEKKLEDEWKNYNSSLPTVKFMKTGYKFWKYEDGTELYVQRP